MCTRSGVQHIVGLRFFLFSVYKRFLLELFLHLRYLRLSCSLSSGETDANFLSMSFVVFASRHVLIAALNTLIQYSMTCK